MTKSHDQNFKNLILDYPLQSIAFFAASEAKGINEQVKVTPIRQEQLKERLGDRFRELDTPLLVEFPNGDRLGLIFCFEEETTPGRFTIDRLVHYCVDVATLMKTDRIVPVVIFLQLGNYPEELRLGTENHTFLAFHFIVCDLAQLNVDQYLNSDNIVARLTLPLMNYNEDNKLQVYSHAVDGLMALEERIDYQLKYIDFVDEYADLSEPELERYRAEFVDSSQTGEKVMGLLEYTQNKGMQKGMQEGMQQGMQKGMQTGIQKGEVNMLLRLMKTKFGNLPDATEARIVLADVDQLLKWSDNILTAKTIDDVFH